MACKIETEWIECKCPVCGKSFKERERAEGYVSEYATMDTECPTCGADTPVPG